MTRPAVRIARRIRWPGIQSRSYGSGKWLTSFTKRAMLWQRSENEPMSAQKEQTDSAARKLKQSLTKTSSNDGEVKGHLLELVRQTDVVAPENIPLVELALNAGVNFTPREKYKLFTSMAKNDSKVIEKCSSLTKLFAEVTEELSNSSELSIVGGYYLKYLLAKGKTQESVQLLDWLLADANDSRVYSVLDIVGKHPEILTDDVLRRLLSGQLSTTTWNLAIEIQTERSKLDGSSISKSIAISKLKTKANGETVVLLLDSCLGLRNYRIGRQVLESIVEPRFNSNSLRLKNDMDMLQLYELVLASTCIFGGNITLGEDMAKRIAEFNREDFAKETWDVLVQWEVYKTRSIEHVGKVIAQMNQAGDEFAYHADEDTLTSALKAAPNYEVAQEIIDYFKSIRLDCNIDAYCEMIRQSLLTNVERSRELFLKSLREGCNWTGHGDGLKVLDDLVVALVDAGFNTFDIFKTYQQIRVFTEAVGAKAQAALVRMFLSQDAVGDVGRFLEEEFGQGRDDTTAEVPVEQVRGVYTSIMSYLMHKCNGHHDAWYLFGVLSRFVVLPPPTYQPIMWRFCQLKRPDAALKIFKTMRELNKATGKYPATNELYVMLFNEFSRMRYEEGVNELHLFLNMDVATDLDMPVMNAVLNAYSEVGNHERVMDLYTQVLSFPEAQGINNDTANVMIKHLTRRSIEEVEEFWLALPEYFKLRPTAENLRQYVVANCYHGYYMRALQVVKTMPDQYGIAPDSETIKQLYNWSMIENRKKQVREYASTEYPQLWQALETSGELKEYLLPENTEGRSDDSLRSEVINQIESDKRRENAYVAQLPQK